MNFSDCTNMPPEPQHGSYTLPVCGLSTATSVLTMLAGVELPAALAFGAGEHAQKVFVHLAQGVARHVGRCAKAYCGYQIDQLAQLAVGQLRAGKALVQNAFEFGVVALDQGQSVVDVFANARLLGLARSCSQRAPSGTQNTLPEV